MVDSAMDIHKELHATNDVPQEMMLRREEVASPFLCLCVCVLVCLCVCLCIRMCYGCCAWCLVRGGFYVAVPRACLRIRARGVWWCVVCALGRCIVSHILVSGYGDV